MDIKDLRIGNWVQTSGTERQIKYLGMKAFFQLKDGKSITFKYENVDPIKLDESWLKKCNQLKWDDKGSRYILNGGHATFWIALKMDYWAVYYMGQSYYFLELPFVHTLQNLYWCLCEKELTTKENAKA